MSQGSYSCVDKINLFVKIWGLGNLACPFRHNFN